MRKIKVGKRYLRSTGEKKNVVNTFKIIGREKKQHSSYSEDGKRFQVELLNAAFGSGFLEKMECVPPHTFKEAGFQLSWSLTDT